MFPVYYPLEDLDGSMMHSPMLSEDTMSIFSGYYVSRKEYHGNLFDMFTMVPTRLWIGYFMSFFVFATIAQIGARLLRQRCSSLWMTVCAFLDQDNFPNGSMFMEVLSFAVMLAMFFMMTYAGNCMGTDLVSIEDPVTITSYEEIIEKGVKIALNRVLPEYDRFQNSPPSSSEGIMFKNRYDYVFTPESAMGLAPMILSQDMVIIARPQVTDLSGLLFAGYYFPTDGRAYVAPVERAQKYTTVFGMSSRIKGTKAERRMTQV